MKIFQFLHILFANASYGQVYVDSSKDNISCKIMMYIVNVLIFFLTFIFLKNYIVVSNVHVFYLLIKLHVIKKVKRDGQHLPFCTLCICCIFVKQKLRMMLLCKAYYGLFTIISILSTFILNNNFCIAKHSSIWIFQKLKNL